jgi:hypothetical protein
MSLALAGHKIYKEKNDQEFLNALVVAAAVTVLRCGYNARLWSALSPGFGRHRKLLKVNETCPFPL